MILNIPIEVPEALEKMGGIALYASMYAGWAPTITVEEYVGNGDDKYTPLEKRISEVPNPMSALEAGIAFKQKQLKDEFRQVMLQMGRESGEKQAIEQFELLFS